MPKQELDETEHAQLKRIKKNVEKAYLYFKPNYDLYNSFRRQVFDTALDSETIALLKTLKKPQIEFNILESYVSRLRGEFSKQEPSIEVMAGDDAQVDVEAIKLVEGHTKHIFDKANQDGFEFAVYTDTLSGGFSAAKVYTDYANEMSMEQVIKLERVFDPCLTGFDPLSRSPHKGDGSFCFELFPYLKEDFELEHPDLDISDLAYSRNIEGFSWSYRNAQDEIIMVCDYYEKKKKRTMIQKMSDGKVITLDNYKKFLKHWEELGMYGQPPPTLVGKPRESIIETIERYRIIDNKILEHVDTDYKMLPLVFFDGNSILIRKTNDNTTMQKCRPYVYHAQGIQKLKNFAGQTLANEFENMIQHKFKIAKEALPLEEDYLQAYRDVQQADILVFNAYNELAPDKMLPPPEVIARVPIPQELVATFTGADNMTQNILGAFDMDISKMNKQQMSGIAIQEAATQNNSAAMPYIVNYLQGIWRIAEIIVDLIPKYYVTPRTIPVMAPDGKRTYQKINQEGGISLKYGEHALNVSVQPGVNFSVQKSRALMQIISMMQASPLFAEFMNTEGLEVLLDNIEIKGIDQIKEMAKNWMQQMKQMKQQQMEQAKNQPNPEQMKMQLEQAKLKQKEMDSQTKLQVDMAKLEHDQMKIMADLKSSHENSVVQTLKSETERFAKMIDLAIKGRDTFHKHRMDLHDRLSKRDTKQ